MQCIQQQVIILPKCLITLGTVIRKPKSYARRNLISSTLNIKHDTGLRLQYMFQQKKTSTDTKQNPNV